MRVPDIARLKNAAEIFDETDASTNGTPIDITENSQRRRRSRRVGRPYDLVSVSDGSSRSTRAQAEAQFLDERRSTCPREKAFCADGFTGCCSVDPCTPGKACPDDPSSSTAHTTKTSSTEVQEITSHLSMNSKSGTSGRKPTTTTHTSPSILTATSSSRTSSTTSQSHSNPVISPPGCPGGNGIIFRDSSGIAYRIHCNADNTYSSVDTVSVGVGGYGECFSACSKTSICAGFTYMGLDSGKCYLKSQMPRDKYVVKEGNNYISCAKMHPRASAPQPGSTIGSKSGKKTPVGAIVGAVIGGVLLIGLLLLLVAFITKRKRKKVEQRRATIVTHLTHGPIETQQLNPSGHQRQVSTSHDVFAPFGGFYRGFQDDIMQRDGAGSSNQTEQKPTATPPGLRAEGGPMILPAAVYRRPRAEETPMLDSTPVERQTSPSSGSRSPRFHEHLSELEDTRSPSMSTQSHRAPSVIVDSPTLGRQAQPMPRMSLTEQVRRKKHLMSWNNYDPQSVGGRDRGDDGMEATMQPSKSRPSPRSDNQISPDSTNEPSEGRFNVSPFGSLDGGRWK